MVLFFPITTVHYKVTLLSPTSFLIYTKHREIDLAKCLFSRSGALVGCRRGFGSDIFRFCGIFGCVLLGRLLFRPLRFIGDPFPVPADFLIHSPLPNKGRIDGFGGGVVDVGSLSGLYDVHLLIVDV